MAPCGILQTCDSTANPELLIGGSGKPALHRLLTSSHEICASAQVSCVRGEGGACQASRDMDTMLSYVISGVHDDRPRWVAWRKRAQVQVC